MSERKEDPATASCEGMPTGLNALAQGLVHWAACRAPRDLSERLEEEWQADLAARHSAGSRMRFALGCCWATFVILREHASASIPVAGAVMEPKGIKSFSGDESGIARRSLTFFLVAGLHIGLFYALMTGLAFRIIKEIPAPFQTRLIQTPQARPLQPLAPPSLTKPRLEVSTPEFPRTENPVEQEDSVVAPGEMPASQPEMRTAPRAREVVRVPGGPGSGFPTADDYYPSTSRRLEEQGVATVRVCVGSDGRLTSDPSIALSSGSPRLDQGALLLAKAGSGHYRPTTEDSRGVPSCYSFRVRFALRPGR